jgi:hypothetical protein
MPAKAKAVAAPPARPTLRTCSDAAREALQHLYTWPLGGSWSYECLSGNEEAGGVWRVRCGTRAADVAVNRIVGQNGMDLRVGSHVIYQWSYGPVEHGAPSPDALFLDLNRAIESALPASHTAAIGIWFIGARKPELRGIVHGGRVFWQRPD